MKRVVIIFLLSILSFNIAFTQNASYNYATSTGTIGTGYNWIDCSTGGTEITSFSQGNAKNGRQEINWPFAFSFYDDNYTTSDQLSIATNGFIRLDANASASWVGVNAYTLNSGGTGFGQIVALCLYNDNFEDAVSHLYYKTTGSSPNRILTVEYNNVEIERYADKYADVQVSFYETSNKVVIKFGDDNITQVGADMGIHSGVSGYFNKWQEVESGTNNTWIEYTRPVKTFNSIVYNQASTGDVIQNQNNAEIMRIDVKVNGGTGTLNLNSIEITADNDADADIASSGVKLYRTTTTTFSTVNMLGTAQSLSGGTATFSSLSYDLPDGTTYIWAVYDIASSA
ncbi:MAG: hypothetical protein KAG84_04220, partial [Bacteroidales bacterium]|nr:hypothetical protein [Bacteroidales bacterium]